MSSINSLGTPHPSPDSIEAVLQYHPEIESSSPAIHPVAARNGSQRRDSAKIKLIILKALLEKLLQRCQTGQHVWREEDRATDI